MPFWLFRLCLLLTRQATCGYEYTSKLQRMFNDIGTSKDLNAKFRDHLKASGGFKGLLSLHALPLYIRRIH